MKQINTIEAIEEFLHSDLIELYSNSMQLLNGMSEEEVISELPSNPRKLAYITTNFFIGKHADMKLYDLGAGYYMMTSENRFHKAVNRMLVAEGIEKPLPEFEETFTIYKRI